MIVEGVQTGETHEVEIVPVEERDYTRITKKRYFFNWQEEKDYNIFKLQIKETDEIIGLISTENIPTEWRIHIRLLTVSVENKGTGKEFEHIVGNLLTFAAKEAVRLYAEMACVSLVPKTTIAQHYIDKFGMNITGGTLSIEIREITRLINKYDHD